MVKQTVLAALVLGQFWKDTPVVLRRSAAGRRDVNQVAGLLRSGLTDGLDSQSTDQRHMNPVFKMYGLLLYQTSFDASRFVANIRSEPEQSHSEGWAKVLVA